VSSGEQNKEKMVQNTSGCYKEWFPGKHLRIKKFCMRTQIKTPFSACLSYLVCAKYENLSEILNVKLSEGIIIQYAMEQEALVKILIT
jgi:hypothetical protein